MLYDVPVVARVLSTARTVTCCHRLGDGTSFASWGSRQR